jgi:D-glycero-alpha-D-manno-heptose 1-phosphate guanylyltransferase
MSVAPSQTVAVVLAGGFGTRVRHLLPGVPKPMATAAGKPFVEWVTRYLGRQGLSRVVLSTGYLAEVIERHFAPQPVPGVRVRCFQETEPLGTGGGFLHAAEASGERPEAWLVLNGDSLVLTDLSPMFEALKTPETGGALLGCRVPDASRYGTMTTGSDGVLRGFDEKKPGPGVISGGVYLLRESLLRQVPAHMPLSFEKEIFPHWIQQGLRLRTVEVNAPFLDIGTPESLRQAEEFIQQNRQWFL